MALAKQGEKRAIKEQGCWIIFVCFNKEAKNSNNGVIMNINRGRIHPITVRVLKIMYQLLCRRQQLTNKNASFGEWIKVYYWRNRLLLNFYELYFSFSNIFCYFSFLTSFYYAILRVVNVVPSSMSNKKHRIFDVLNENSALFRKAL